MIQIYFSMQFLIYQRASSTAQCHKFNSTVSMIKPP